MMDANNGWRAFIYKEGGWRLFSSGFFVFVCLLCVRVCLCVGRRDFFFVWNYVGSDNFGGHKNRTKVKKKPQTS